MKSFKLFACLSLCAITIHGHAQDVDPMSGTFALVDQASDDINAAVDAATASLNFVSRPIARSVIKSRHPRFARVAIAREGGAIVVTFDNLQPMKMPADGSDGKWTRADGEVLTVNAQTKDRGLIQTILTNDTKRTNDFRLDADGSRMTLVVSFTSEQLPHPMRYQLVYQRAVPR